MNNLNSLIIEGIVESNPVITVSAKGTPICSFTLISKRVFKDDGVSQKEDAVEVTIETWARLAEICRECCTKRCSVRIVGRLKQNMTNGNVGVIAEKMGISQAAYSQMETAKKNRKATLQKIAEAMNIDYLQLKI